MRRALAIALAGAAMSCGSSVDISQNCSMKLSVNGGAQQTVQCFAAGATTAGTSNAVSISMTSALPDIQAAQFAMTLPSAPSERTCLHQRDEDVDQLAGLGADDCRAQDALGLRIEEHLQHTRLLVDLDGAGDLPERHRRRLVGDAALARFALGEPDPRHLGIGEGGVRDVASLAAAPGTAEEQVEEDAVIVPRGVRELRLADHVAHRVRPGGAGAVLVVGDDEALRVERD